MSQKIVELPGYGKIVVARRKGAKHIRLSVDSKGRARLSLPFYIPLSAGLMFVKTKQDWLHKQKSMHTPLKPYDGMRIGRSYKLSLKWDPTKKNTYTKLVDGKLNVYNFIGANDLSLAVLEKSVLRCLKKDAELYLPARLEHKAKYYGYKYNHVKVKLLRSRWGSCSSTKKITLSVFLVQLPWRLVDYVLLHELVHTSHLNHGDKFWGELASHMPDYKLRRRELKAYKPSILSNSR